MRLDMRPDPEIWAITIGICIALGLAFLDEHLASDQPPEPVECLNLKPTQ